METHYILKETRRCVRLLSVYYVHNGQAQLEVGTPAGRLDRTVCNMARWTNVGLGGAWQMASLNPARQLGIDDHVGWIAPGYDAGQLVLTMVGGEIVYHA